MEKEQFIEMNLKSDTHPDFKEFFVKREEVGEII